METAADVIKSALQEIVVQASEAPIEPDEAQDAIKYMNRMMAAFATEGIQLGYTKVANLGDDITIPDGAVEGLVFNLAMRLARQFGAVATQELFINAREGKDAMRKLSISVGPSFFSGNVPVGSGIEGDNQLWDNHFYNDPNDAILTEQGGFIATESETIFP